MEKQIFWIASFPKSGNTLLRSILSALFFTHDGIFSFDKLRYISQFEKTIHVENNKKIFGNDFSRLNNTSVFYKYIIDLQTKKSLGISEDFIFLKTHSGLFKVGDSAFTSNNNTRGIIYVLRDPRDVCISWSKHLDISLDESVNHMINEAASGYWIETSTNDIFKNTNRPKSLYSSWEKHVLSWTSINWDLPIKIIKYEDLVYDKKNTVISLIDFFTKNFNFDFKNTDTKLNNIINSTSFHIFKKEEEEKGFSESTGKNKFFSVGKKDQWKEKLSKDQVLKLENKFGSVMKKYNYKLSVEF